MGEVAETVESSLNSHSEATTAQIAQHEQQTKLQSEQISQSLDSKVVELQQYALDQQHVVEDQLGTLRQQAEEAKIELARQMGKQTSLLSEKLEQIHAETSKIEAFTRQKIESVATKLATCKAHAAQQLEEQTQYIALAEEGLQSRCQSLESRLEAVIKQNSDLKELVLKAFREDQLAQDMLKEYVGKIASQVSSVMNYAMTIRLEENNKLIDATLKARVPDYVKNASTSFALVRNSDPNSEAVVVPHIEHASMEELLQRARTNSTK